MIIAIAHFFLGCLMVLLHFLANKLNGNGVQNLGNLQTVLGLGMLLGLLYIRKKKNDGIIHVFFIFRGQWKKLKMLFPSYVQSLLKPLIIRSMFILQWLVY